MVNFKIESGRSMVEMLGVLAIIGVLSVGGIYGYKTAMEHIEYNNFMNDVNTILAQYKGIEVEDSYYGETLNLGITPKSSLLKGARVFATGQNVKGSFQTGIICPGCICLSQTWNFESGASGAIDKPFYFEALRKRVNALPFGVDPAMWIGRPWNNYYYLTACTPSQEGYVMVVNVGDEKTYD